MKRHNLTGASSRWISEEAYAPVIGDSEPEDVITRKPRKEAYGKLGTMYEAFFKHPETEQLIPGQWAWQLRGSKIIRGFQRRGIKARDFDAEAVYANEKTSPRLEIPAIVVETMRIENHGRADSKQLATQDLCVYWRLFAHARLNGFHLESHSMSLTALKQYLDVADGKRVVRSLEKIAATTISLHLNQPGFHGRKSMRMIEDVTVTDGVVKFRMPEAMRAAVLHSRGYGFIDINALPRFRSKFTIPLYIRLCHKAGQHWSKRADLELTREEFRALTGMPRTTKPSVLEAVIKTVRDDLAAISGKRKRFKIEFQLPTEHDNTFAIAVGSSVQRLKEVHARRITREALVELEKIASHPLMNIGDAFWPEQMRLRQAATLVRTSVWKIADQWRTDVWGCLNHTHEVAGMSALDFQKMLRTAGADDAFEWWLDRKEFQGSPNSRRKHMEDVGEAGIRASKRRPERTAEANKPTPEWQPESLTYDDWMLKMPDPNGGAWDDAKVDDAEIPF